MEIEAINTSAGFSSAESPKAPASRPEPVESVKTAAVIENELSPASKAEDRKGGEPGEKKERAASEATIDDAVKSANRKMVRTRCEYSYHKETNRVSIKVLNADTDEVIREIPPEKSLDMLQKMWEMAGILVDERR